MLRAAASVSQLEGSGYRGAALNADIVAGRAGIDALEGRWRPRSPASGEALRSIGGLGLAFDEAAAAVDMATLLPPSELSAPDLQAWISTARATLERLGAAAVLARLDGSAGCRCRPHRRCPDRAARSRRRFEPSSALTPANRRIHVIRRDGSHAGRCLSF